MEPILSLIFPFPKDHGPRKNLTYFTVIINKKSPCRLVGQDQFTGEEKIVYSDIVPADSEEQAIFEAFFNYFMERLAKLHQYESSRTERIQMVGFWATRLSLSAMERCGTSRQILTPFTTKWHAITPSS